MGMIINTIKIKNGTFVIIVLSQKVYLHDFLHHVVSIIDI